MTKELGKNPMHRLAGAQLPEHRLPDWRTTLPLAQSCPRCGARTRAGTPCQSPAMGNGRCRMHGGTSTGPKTAAGLGRIRKARMIHGLYGAEMTELREHCAALRAEARQWEGEF